MRGLPIVLAFVLLASPARAVDFGLAKLDDGGGSGVTRSTAAFVGLGVLGTGALAVGTIRYLGQGGTPYAGLLALPIAALLHYGLGQVLDVPVTAWSAAEGTVLGLATAGVGFLLGRVAAEGLGTKGSLDRNGMAVIGLVVGGAVGTPVWTLLDPMAYAVPGSGGDAVFRAESDRVGAR